jgi:hypothetical protein
MPIRKCDLCQNPTENPRFCSRSCAASVNNKKYVKRKNYNTCSSCNLPLKPGRKYCDECYQKTFRAQDMTLKEAIYKKHHKSSAFALVRARARATDKAKNAKCCELCGWDKHFEVCHVKPISDFSENAMLSEINKDCNIIILCPNCHWLFDHK